MLCRTAVGLLLLAGCTSGSTAAEADGAQTVEPAATVRFLAQVHARTDAASSASYAWELRSRDASDASGEPSDAVVMLERGAYDRSRQRLTAETVPMGPGGQPAGAPLRVVTDDGALYVQPGYLAETFGVKADDWIADPVPSADARPDGVQDTLGAGAPAGIGSRGVGLGWLLGPLLADVTGDVVIVSEAGADRVRGEPTTHLRAQADGSAMSGIVDYPGLIGHTDDVTIDAWVDGEGRLRRIDADAGALILRIELFDYEEPVPVEIPEESQIVLTHTELLGRALAQFAAG